MRIYIAGGSDELEVAEHYIAQARDAGATITFDWPAKIRQVRAAGSANDAALSLADKRENAEADIVGIYTADCVWGILPANKSEGLFFELGYAHGRRIPFVLSGPRCNDHIFSSFAAMRYWEHDHALCALRPYLGNLRRL